MSTLKIVRRTQQMKMARELARTAEMLGGSASFMGEGLWMQRDELQGTRKDQPRITTEFEIASDFKGSKFIMMDHINDEGKTLELAFGPAGADYGTSGYALQEGEDAGYIRVEMELPIEAIIPSK